MNRWFPATQSFQSTKPISSITATILRITSVANLACPTNNLLRSNHVRSVSGTLIVFRQSAGNMTQLFLTIVAVRCPLRRRTSLVLPGLHDDGGSFGRFVV